MPTQAGYRIAPRYPFSHFKLRLPQIGVASETDRMRGYVKPQRGGSLKMTVELPAGRHQAVATWAAGHMVGHSSSGRTVTFTLPTTARHPANWAVTWR
jgi:hypothetical protein